MKPCRRQLNLTPSPIAQKDHYDGSQSWDQHKNYVVLGPLACGSLDAKLLFSGDKIFERIEDCAASCFGLGKGLFSGLATGLLTEQRIDRFGPCSFQVVDIKYALFLAGVIGDQRCGLGDIFPKRVTSIAKLGQVS